MLQLHLQQTENGDPITSHASSLSIRSSRTSFSLLDSFFLSFFFLGFFFLLTRNDNSRKQRRRQNLKKNPIFVWEDCFFLSLIASSCCFCQNNKLTQKNCWSNSFQYGIRYRYSPVTATKSDLLKHGWDSVTLWGALNLEFRDHHAIFISFFSALHPPAHPTEEGRTRRKRFWQHPSPPWGRSILAPELTFFP